MPRTDTQDRAAVANVSQHYRMLIRAALSLLDDIATNKDSAMAMDDIEDLCAARTVLARALGTSYDGDEGRYHLYHTIKGE